MGADLYLDSLHQPQCGRYEPRFEQWVQKRDRAGNAADRDKAQRQVERYYARMYERGYFRDSYNRTSLLVLFGLSWWLHIGMLLEERNEGRVLSPANAEWLLDLLRRQEAVFEDKLQRIALAEGERRPIVERYFRDKYAYFQECLQAAIDRNEPIRCSI